jgi:hypothetical protein
MVREWLWILRDGLELEGEELDELMVTLFVIFYVDDVYMALHKSQTVTAADKKRRRVGCEICGAIRVAGSYQSYLESQHDVFRSMVLQRDIVVDHPAVVYRAIKLLSTGKYFCLVPHCVGKASTKWALRRHFLHRHPQNFVVLPSKGTAPFPQCKRCGMQTETEEKAT